MQEVKINLPSMYADHHVLSVRAALSALDGVSEIIASSAAKRVTVKCDDSVSRETIAQALSEAGYVPDQELPLAQITERSKDGSGWYSVLERPTETSEVDRAMSGDHRRY